MRLGSNHRGHWSRIKSAFTNKWGHLSTLYGLLKDHKPREAGQPPKMRPVCGANVANNAQLSHMLSVIVSLSGN